MSYKYAAMLRALDEDVVALREEFPEGIDDVDLLQKLKGRNIVFVTGDRRIRNVTVEFETLRAARVTSLFLGPFWNNKLFWDQAVWLLRYWAKIRGFVEGASKGTCAEIKNNGRADVFQL